MFLAADRTFQHAVVYDLRDGEMKPLTPNPSFNMQSSTNPEKTPNPLEIQVDVSSRVPAQESNDEASSAQEAG